MPNGENSVKWFIVLIVAIVVVILAATMRPATSVKTVTSVTESIKPIILAGNSFPGARVHLSVPRDDLIAAAQAHADYMASVCKQGHQYWEVRSARLPYPRLQEICAESWEWQAKSTETELWYEAFKCWKQSPGHWSVASKEHKYFGYGLAKGRNDIWYMCIIAAQ